MRQVIIYGAGHHGRVVLETLRAQGSFEVAGFLDNDPSLHGSAVDGVQVYADPRAFKPSLSAAIVAIGSNCMRVAIANTLRPTFELINAVHPSAVVMSRTIMGTGILICAGAVVVTGARIENDVIINTHATIDHDSVLHAGAQVAAGVHTAGRAIIGYGAFVGVGAVLGPGVTIGDGSIVGAGSVVLTDVPPNVLAFGTPAKVIRQLTGPIPWPRILGGNK